MINKAGTEEKILVISIISSVKIKVLQFLNCKNSMIIFSHNDVSLVKPIRFSYLNSTKKSESKED